MKRIVCLIKQLGRVNENVLSIHLAHMYPEFFGQAATFSAKHISTHNIGEFMYINAIK